MVEVKNQSNTTLAKYRYNGLGYRIMWQYDANSNGSLTTSERYYFAYDERWRMLATYRDQDSNPKERFVYHAAGMGGFGGSSYIDQTVLRDRDANTAWTSAADSTMEERTYLCQNWRADVVAAVDAGTTNGLYVKQRIKYDSYGAPRFHGIADYTGETWVDFSDSGDFSNDYSLGSLRADINFDNGVDINDDLTFNAAYGAGGPDTGLRKLYAGYEWDPISAYGTGPGWYHVRHRVLLAETGRWSRRDPIGYVDGGNVFGYLQNSPANNVDSTGLCAESTVPACRFVCDDYMDARREYVGAILAMMVCAIIPEGLSRTACILLAAYAIDSAAIKVYSKCQQLQDCEFTATGKITTPCENRGVWPPGYVLPRIPTGPCDWATPMDFSFPPNWNRITANNPALRIINPNKLSRSELCGMQYEYNSGICARLGWPRLNLETGEFEPGCNDPDASIKCRQAASETLHECLTTGPAWNPRIIKPIRPINPPIVVVDMPVVGRGCLSGKCGSKQ